MIKNFSKRMGRFNPYNLTAILLTISMVVYKIILVVSGLVDNWRGDSSQRLIMANGFSQDWEKFLTGNFWSNIWPPGQFTFLGLIYEFQRQSGLTSLHYVQSSLIASSLLYALSIYPVYLLARKVGSEKAGLFAVILFTGSFFFNELSFKGLAETYALPFMVIGFLYLVRYERGESPIWISGISFSLGTMMRSEVALIFPVIFFWLIWKKHLKNAFIFGFTASSFTFLKYLVVMIFFPGSSQYYKYNHGDIVTFYGKYLENFPHVLRAFKYAIFDNFNFFLALFSICCLVFFLFKSKFKKVWVYLYCFIFTGAFLFICLVIGMYPSDARYFYIPALMMVLITSVGLSVVVEFLENYKFIPKNAVFGVLVLTLGVMAIVNLNRVQDKVKSAIPVGVVEARDWLNKNLQDEDFLYFDFLQNYDQYLHAYTDRVDLMRASFSYSYHPPIKNIVSGTPRNKVVTIRSHEYIKQFRPKYLVLSGSRIYDYLKKATFGGTHIKASYIRPFIKPCEEDGETCKIIVSPIINSQIKIRQVFGNEDIEVYELVSIEPLQTNPLDESKSASGPFETLMPGTVF